MKTLLSDSPLSVFSYKVHNIRFKKQIRILFELTVIELGPPVSEFSSRISKVNDPADPEYKFHKTRIKNWLSLGFKLGSP